MQKLTDIDLNGKRVLIRVDYNVPMQEGRVQNDFRIRASMPTIKHCLKNGASVVLTHHCQCRSQSVLRKRIIVRRLRKLNRSQLF